MSRPKGTGCVYHRGDVWWIKYSRNGKAFCESAHTTDKNKAGKLLRNRLAEINTGTFLGPQIERVTIEELMEDFLSEYRANQRRSIGNAQARWLLHLKPFFGVYRAAQLTTPLLNRYVESRQQQSAQNSTINRELAALKRGFNLGRRNQKVRNVLIFPRLAENNVRSGFVDDAQYRKLAEHSKELWFRAVLEVARTYGWRKREVIGMRVNQVDLFRRTIRLEPGTTKNKEGREVSMTESVFTLLAACVTGKASDGYVFTREGGTAVRDFRKTWANACCAAGLGKLICETCSKDFADGKRCPTCKQPLKYKGLIVHDLRRTAARNLRRAGVAEGVIQKIGGWKTRSVFERYNIVTQSDIQDAMLKLQHSEQKSEAVTQNGYNFGYSGTKNGALANA